MILDHAPHGSLAQDPVLQAAAPVIAIVIPVFRHSALLPEAVESALAQRGGPPVAVVIVDDGCPFAETRAVASAYAMADPRVTYLRKRNGGLSSARNHGIDFALRSWPSLRAVYFLDADNRLTQTAMQNAFAMLEGDGVDWVYPSIDKFGLEWSGNYAAPYSRLAHLTFDNICEAGSLVHRRVLDAGIRFDEAMKQGYEDWDFWLQAVARGFRGKCHPGFGFEYRQRAESMVRDSARLRAGILDTMRRKHRALWTPGNLLRWEHEESPRFALFRDTAGEVEWLSDPALPPRRLTLGAHAEAFAAEGTEPEGYGTPPMALWLPEAAVAALRGAGLLHNLLWQVERLLARHDLVAIRLEEAAGSIGLAIGAAGDAPVLGWAARQVVLREGDAEALAAAMAAPPAGLTLRFPGGGLAPAGGAPDPRATMEALRSPRRRRWTWRDGGALPEIRDYPRHLAAALGADHVQPLVRHPGGRLALGFALPAGAGGRLRVAAALAGALRAAGCATHLFLLGGSECRLEAGVREGFETVNFLALPDLPEAGPHGFMGEKVALAGDLAGADRTLLGLLAGMDVLVASGTPMLGPVLAELRRLGVKVVGHLHGAGRSRSGRGTGDPYVALAFEHAHDLLLASSPALADWLHGAGVPEAKIIELPATGSALAFPPRGPRAPGPLRALLLGEDAAPAARKLQAAAVLATRMAGLPVEWRAAGALPPGLAALGVAPAGEEAAALAAADLLVLPACAEATPMVVLDAQRAGCIPVLTRGESAAPLAHGGAAGVLVGDEVHAGDWRGLVAALSALAADPVRLARLSASAVEAAAEAPWGAGAAPVLAQLRAWFPGVVEDDAA